MDTYYIKQFNVQDNALCVLKNLMHLIGVKITASSINRIVHHPDYPGLTSLSDSLSDWRVDNMGVKLNLEQLQEIPLPAIAHLNKYNGYFVVLSKIENDSLQYLDPETGWVSETFNDFEKKWSGVALLVSANETSGERNYKLKRKLEIAEQAKPMALVLLSTLLFVIPTIAVFSSSFFLPWVCLLLIKATGLGLCITLLVKQTGMNNSFVNKVCNAAKNFNCSSIINSPASKLFGMINMSELGMLYFAGGVLSLLLNSIADSPVFGILLWLGAATLPYTAFSIYYQWRVIKSWCPFCLAVMLLFWVEFFILLSITSFNVVLDEVLIGIIGFAIPVIGWLLFRHSFVNAHLVDGLKRSVLKFKQSSNIFNALLEKQPPVEIKEFSQEIILGNKSASTSITVVSNPLCGPCSFAHQVLEDLVKRYPDQLKVKIRFLVNPAKQGSVEYIVSKEMLRKAIAGSMESVNQALHTWFASNERDIVKWKEIANNYERMPDELIVDELFKSHFDWCTAEQINMTPTFFINNKKLPEEYNVIDLKYHIRQLIGVN